MLKTTKKIIVCICLPLMFITNSNGEDDFWSTQPQTEDIEASVITTTPSSTLQQETSQKVNEHYDDENWLTQARIDVPSPGMVEAVFMPELHWNGRSRAYFMKNQMDICLYGPEENPRAFELFWREKGKEKSLFLEKTSIELNADKQLVWEGCAPEKLNIKKVIIDISDSNYVGKVDIEGLSDTGWVWLAKNAALYKNNRLNQADITINKGMYQKFRLYFSGYNKEYHEIPLFVNTVKIVGEPSGRDYATVLFKPGYEEAKNDQGSEIRIVLPGLGIWIDKIDITTSALFKGSWNIGHEKVVLGKKGYSQIKHGNISHVDNNKQTFSIDVGEQWEGRVLIVRMHSKDYFGKAEQVNIHARVPRMVFFADKAGNYIIRTGCGKNTKILDVAGDRERDVEHELAFEKIERNHQWRPENLIEKYNIKGGPFTKKGYTWGADVQIQDPGFYQLVLNEQACLEEKVEGLRLVKNQKQIPYIIGPQEERKILLETTKEYDDVNNRTTWTMKLPFASAQWKEIQLKAKGIFVRTLLFKKHTPGMIGWQPFKTIRWTSKDNQATVFKLGLESFPEDQDEIQLVINHGDNQPLALDEINVLYKARDIFFLADKTGDYELYGGNPHSKGASYKDLEIIMDHLLDAVPKQVNMSDIKMIEHQEVKSVSSGDIGGPFDSKGYTWTSKISGISKPGFYQLSLNQRASLEKNRRGLRLVKDDTQIPYFMGNKQKREIEIKAESEYNRKDNKTSWLIRLPQPSYHWHAIQLYTDGIFDRTLVFEIRKPGKTGWQPWRRHRWTNRSKGETMFAIQLRDFPKDLVEMRLVIKHGDNQPIEISKIKAVYMTQDLFFVARSTGGFELAGGNPDAGAPSYDLALIQNHLLKSEPIKIDMDDLEELKPAEWEARLTHMFSEQGWGLYVVLGIVTMILLVVIVKLFPKEEE